MRSVIAHLTTEAIAVLMGILFIILGMMLIKKKIDKATTRTGWFMIIYGIFQIIIDGWFVLSWITITWG